MESPPSDEILSGVVQEPLSCWWKIPGSEIIIQLEMGVVDRINRRVKGPSPVGFRSKEVRGLLLGTIAVDPALQLIVSDCVPLVFTGPGQRLSEADKRSLRKQIDKCKAVGKLNYILAYYRSSHSPEFRLTPEDMEFVRDFVPDSFFILLVRPSAAMNVGALYFPPESGQAEPECRLLLPFERKTLLSGRTLLSDSSECVQTEPAFVEQSPEMSTELPSAPSQKAVRAPERVPDRLISQRSAPPSGKAARVWISLAALLVLAIAGIAFIKMRNGSIPHLAPETEAASNAVEVESADPDLDLQARAEGDRIQVTWNRTPSIMAARRGILSMWDGSSTETLTLDRDDLLRGSVAVPHDGKRVSVQMLLISEERSVGSVSDGETGPEPAQAAPAASAAPMKTNQWSAVSGGTASAAVPQKATQAAPEPASSGHAATAAEAEDVDSAMQAGSSPQRTPAESAAASLPETEDSPQPVEESPAAAPAVSAASVPDRPPVSTPPAKSEPEPKPEPVLVAKSEPPKAPVAAAAPPPAAASDASVPARPLDGVNAVVIPSNLRSRMPETAEMDIRVYVDATGAVIGAKSMFRDPQISKLAVDAVRRMRFAPAQRGNRPVASDLILRLPLIVRSQ